jgi:hypothetical protein
MGNETRLLFHFIHVISPRISQNNIYLIIKSFDFLTSQLCMYVNKRINRVGGVMDSVFYSSAVDRRFELWSGQIKDYIKEVFASAWNQEKPSSVSCLLTLSLN